LLLLLLLSLVLLLLDPSMLGSAPQPNAEAQFLEVKNAFQVLSDAQQRAEYDRKLRWVSGWVEHVLC
jgi:hypothetical protein